MIKDSDFYCQFVSYTNENIARTTCGVTSLAMVLSAKGVFSRFQNSERLLDDFFDYLNSHHKNDLPCVKRKLVFKDRVIPVTVGLASHIIPLETDYLESDHNFFPVFLLNRGYDHRASEVILQNFGLHGRLQENVTTEDLYQLFTSNTCEYFLASVKSKFVNKADNSISTHIVVVHKLTQHPAGDITIQYIDPAEDTYTKALIELKLNEFSKIYNGFGTLIFCESN
jgi:hypothetical protein